MEWQIPPQQEKKTCLRMKTFKQWLRRQSSGQPILGEFKPQDGHLLKQLR